MELVLLVSRIDGIWTQNMIQGFLDACEELELEGTVLNCQYDNNLLLLNLSQVLNQGVDGVAIMSSRSISGWGIMTRALASNIPIISIDEKISDSQGRQLVPYVGIDNQAAGNTAALWASGEIKRIGWLQDKDISLGVAVFTYNELVGMRERSDAFLHILKVELPDLQNRKVFLMDCTSGSAVNGLLAMQQLLARHPEISHWLVFGVTAESAIGAVRGLEQLGLGNNALACGIDGGAGFREFSKERITPYSALVYVDTYAQGQKTARILYDYQRRRKPIPIADNTEIKLIPREEWKISP